MDVQEGFLVRSGPKKIPGLTFTAKPAPRRPLAATFMITSAPTATKWYFDRRCEQKRRPGGVDHGAIARAVSPALLRTWTTRPVLKELNAGLVKRSQRGMFCTLCYLTLDLTSGHVVCANAGHHPVLRVGRTEVSTFGDATGPPAGILPEGPWVETRAIIDPGDTLLLYTDGIVEARSMTTLIEGATPSPPVEYEEAGLMRCASRQFGKPARALIDAVILDVQRYTAPAAPHDDCTMMALRYAGGR